MDPPAPAIAPEPDTLRFTLPLPPTVNQMLALAKRRTRKAASGGWMKRAVPIVYDNAKKAYEVRCMVELARQGVAKPRKPWQYWSLLAVEFRTRSRRDWTELAAGLKWPVDALVSLGYVEDDDPGHLCRPEAWPTQRIDRQDPAVDLTIRREDSVT